MFLHESEDGCPVASDPAPCASCFSSWLAQVYQFKQAENPSRVYKCTRVLYNKACTPFSSTPVCFQDLPCIPGFIVRDLVAIMHLHLQHTHSVRCSPDTRSTKYESEQQYGGCRFRRAALCLCMLKMCLTCSSKSPANQFSRQWRMTTSQSTPPCCATAVTCG